MGKIVAGFKPSRFWNKLAPAESGTDEILSNAGQGELSLGEIKALLSSPASDWPDIFETADKVKQKFFGKKMFFYVPLYISSFCADNCLYCDYRRENPALPRKRLGFDEFRAEADYLDSLGYSRIELVSGSDPLFPFERLLKFTKHLAGCGKRVLMNNRSLKYEEYAELKQAGLSESWLFMETYDPVVYGANHPPGPKQDYQYRLKSYEWMGKAGLDIGVAFLSGLSGDWKSEVLSVIAHAKHLRKKYGSRMAFSTPRFKHAFNAPLSDAPYSVPDDAFRLTVALYRLALNDCMINVSTREPIGLLEKLWKGGASLTNPEAASIPGGYTLGVKGSQFAHFSYSQDLFVSRIKKMGLTPIL
mgnify:CR=1 FL=1